MVRPPVGYRLRELRRQRGLTQAAVAARAGVSASYLNLIEHGKRDVAGARLRRIAEALGVDAAVLGGVEEMRLVQDMTEVATDPLLGDLRLDAAAVPDMVGRYPKWTQALLRLHRSYGAAATLAASLADRLAHDATLVQASHELLTRITSIRSFAEILEEHADLESGQRQRFTHLLAEESRGVGGAVKALFEHLSDFGADPRPATPAQEVDDFIIDSGNYFSALEDAALALASRLRPERAGMGAALVDCLARHHGVQVERGAADGIAEFSFDRERGLLQMPLAMPSATQRFQLARLLFSLEAEPAVRALTADRRLTSEVARERAAQALFSYGAGALLLPYDPFRAAADRERHDLDRLAALFGASMEQVCHRLVTLRRPGAEGVPFAFLRVDAAGNVSKRFSLPTLRLPRQGGACPLWAIYRAFHAPGSIAAQRVRLPDGREFLFVARTTAKPARSFQAQPQIHSVMIGCEAPYANRVVYGDGLGAAAGLAIETGINCHLCPRTACPQRAYPSVLAGPSGLTEQMV